MFRTARISVVSECPRTFFIMNYVNSTHSRDDGDLGTGISEICHTCPMGRRMRSFIAYMC